MASRVLGAFVVAGTTVLTSLALATPASAHTPFVGVDCVEQGQKSVLSVELKDYNTQKGKNTLTVVIDEVEVKKTTFDKNFKKETWERDSKTTHTYKVTIIASDDNNGFAKNPDWSKEYVLSNEKCVKTPPKPEEPKPPRPEQPKPPQPEQPPVVTTTEAPSSSVTPPAPGGSTPEPPLAATGASPLWLLLSGLGLVGAGAGTLLFLRRRRSA